MTRKVLGLVMAAGLLGQACSESAPRTSRGTDDAGTSSGKKDARPSNTGGSGGAGGSGGGAGGTVGGAGGSGGTAGAAGTGGGAGGTAGAGGSGGTAGSGGTGGMSATGGVNVPTMRNDNARTGHNSAETVLTHQNVNKATFGKVFDLKVDGQVYGQPLIMSGVTVPGKGKLNLALVTTQKNKVYAFDADKGGEPIWMKDFATYPDPEPPVPHPSADFDNAYCPTYNILPWIGTTSTPAIDPATGTMYVSAFSGTTKDGKPLPAWPDPKRIGCPQFSAMANAENKYKHKLHALDIATGEEKFNGPGLVEASVPGTGEASDGKGNVVMQAKQHLQRVGLLLQDDTVYLAFGAFSDSPPYHGWVLGYNAKDVKTRTAIFNASPNDAWAGIWQAGHGLVGDGAGIYFMTGNGKKGLSWNAGKTTYFPNAFVKLGKTLSVSKAWIHDQTNNFDNGDTDLGSSGPVAIPGTDWLIGGGKDGHMQVFKRSDMSLIGKFLASFTPDAGASDTKTNCNKRGTREHIHGAPPVYPGPNGKPWVYVWAENDFLKAWELEADGLPKRGAVTGATIQCKAGGNCGIPVSTSKVVGGCGMPGGILSMSSNQGKAGTGILWANRQKSDALHGPKPATLWAFDATDLTKVLWSSDDNASDTIAIGSKNTPPTIANGKVYMGGGDVVQVYGVK